MIDGNGGGESLDHVHVGLVHLPEEHTGIGRQGLHEAAVPLRVDGVKRERGFARAGKPRHHHQLVAGDGEVDIFEIMDTRALNNDLCLHGAPFCNDGFGGEGTGRDVERRRSCVPLGLQRGANGGVLLGGEAGEAAAVYPSAFHDKGQIHVAVK